MSELTRDVIAGFYRTFSALGFVFVEAVYRRALAVELRRAGLGVEREVAFELFHSGEWIGRYRADLIVQQQLIIEVKSGPSLDPNAIPQLLNYECDKASARSRPVLWTEAEGEARHSRPHARISHH